VARAKPFSSVSAAPRTPARAEADNGQRNITATGTTPAGLKIFASSCRIVRSCFVFKVSEPKEEISMAQSAQATPNPEVKPLPQVKGGVIPYLTVDGVTKAVEFYKKAFAAEVAFVQPPDEKGRTMHAHLYINGSSLMMSDAYPEHGHPLKEPAAFNIMLPVQDVDAWYDRAVKAGCTATMPPADMFWGDRYGQLKDPFRVTWAINGPIKK
jgi:PhnB protein